MCNVHTKTMYLLYSETSESVFVPLKKKKQREEREEIHFNTWKNRTNSHLLKYFGVFGCDGRLAWEKLLYAIFSFFFPASVCQSDIHLLEAVLHKQTTPKATTGWLNNHGLFSLFSTIAHCKFLVGPQHAHLCLFNKQPTCTDNFTSEYLHLAS